MKATNKKLLSSVMILALCVTMFVGSTYAWFTDTVTSAGNKIQSGTLKVDLELLDKDTNEWSSIKDSKEALFDYDKWEPGYTEAKILKIENEGTLALKWFAKFVSNAELGILADVIDVYVLPDATAYPLDRSLDGYTKVGTVADFVNTIETTTYGTLEAGKSATLGIALKMRESADNAYQNQTLGAFDILIEANQKDFEKDSFGNEYDITAPAYPVSTAAELIAALNDGKSVVLTDNITFDGAIETVQKVDVDLNGKTLATSGWTIANGGTIKNGTIVSEKNTAGALHLQIAGGTLNMDTVDVVIDDYMNMYAEGNRAYAEYFGMDVVNAVVTLDDCNIQVKCEDKRTWNFLYGIGMTNGDVYMNGGSITIESAGAYDYEDKVAFSNLGNSRITMNNVNVQAASYGMTLKNGHLVVNTTDHTVGRDNFVSYSGGTFELNYID